MFSIIFGFLQGILSLFSWFKGNKDQKIGKLEQQNEDDKTTLKVAQDASNIKQKVGDENNDQLDADLSKRLRG